MAKYFVDFEDDDGLLEDVEGSDCESLSQARAQAVGVLRQIVWDQLSPVASRRLQSTVRDADGRILYVATIEFRSEDFTGPGGNGAARNGDLPASA